MDKAGKGLESADGVVASVIERDLPPMSMAVQSNRKTTAYLEREWVLIVAGLQIVICSCRIVLARLGKHDLRIIQKLMKSVTLKVEIL